MTAPKQYVFGPVPSRRLGRSLGVDLVPFKSCTLDCLYCQIGHTTVKTIEPFTFADVETLIEQLGAKLEAGPRPDYVTISGSGEPTLCANLGEVLEAVQGVTDVDIAILTNGTLLWRPEVREACSKADLVVPSLDAGSEETFRRINRPCPELTLQRLVAGLIAFRKIFHGRLWLEVFLIAGVNTSIEETDRMRALIDRIGPDRVQLNTAVRPTAEAEARALTAEEMEEVRERFGDGAEIIASFPGRHDTARCRASADDILQMVSRRPCTLRDIAEGLGIHVNEAVKYVQQLTDAGRIKPERRDEDIFYAMR